MTVVAKVIPVTLIGTMSVGTALAVCLIFSSGVGRGGALVHTTCPSNSDPSPPSPSGVWLLMESWDLSSSADEAVDWMRKRKKWLMKEEWSNRREKARERKGKVGEGRGGRDNRNKEWKNNNWQKIEKEGIESITERRTDKTEVRDLLLIQRQKKKKCLCE